MINKVIKQLIYYDFLVQFALGLSSPIFAIFILKNIQGSTLSVIGLATAFYWLARVTTTVPLSRFMDKTDGERDEFYFAVVGSAIVATIPLMYLVASQPWHIYLIQFIFGLANSMAVPAWRILFVDHTDKGKTGFEWSLEDVGVGTAVGTSAFLGSILAQRFGFPIVFTMVSMLGYAGTIMLLPLNKYALTLNQLKKSGRFKSIKDKRKNLLPGSKKSVLRRSGGVA